MQKREAKTIHEVSAPLNMLVDSLDLPALRIVFAELFDRTNEGILAAKLDADDVILERFVDLRTADGTTSSAPVEWLSDAERLKSEIRAWSGSDTTTLPPYQGGTQGGLCPTATEWFRAAPVRKRVQGDCRSKECETGLVIVSARVRAVVDDSP